MSDTTPERDAARMAVGMIAGMALVAIVLWSCSGCAAVRPFASVDNAGYRIGVEGTWIGVGEEVQRVTGQTVYDK